MAAIYFMVFCACLTLVFFAVAWIIGQSLLDSDKLWETPSEIGRRIGTQTVKEYLSSDKFDSLVDEAITKELEKPEYAWFAFVKAMHRRLAQADSSLANRKGLDIAIRTYRLFLEDNNIEFGADGYDWTEAGARAIVEEYEIGYWENAA